MSSARRRKPGLNAIHCGVTLLLAVTGIGLHANADTYYHWKDAEGNPILSDRPPPDGIAYEVQETPQREMMPEDVEDEEPEIEAAVENKGPTSSPTETSAERCERARANLEALGGKDVVTVRNSAGEPRELTSAEKQVQLEATRAQINVYCED